MHPAPPEIEARLGEWQKEASLQSRFYEARGAHFAVRFEGPGDELLARATVDRLEEQYWRIGQTLTAYPPNPITVVLYTQQQFRDITRLPSWTAAAYDGRIHVPMRGALEQTEELDRVLGHEFVHAVVFMLGGRNVPVWLNEGLATHLERGGAEDAERLLAATRANRAGTAATPPKLLRPLRCRCGDRIRHERESRPPHDGAAQRGGCRHAATGPRTGGGLRHRVSPAHRHAVRGLPGDDRARLTSRASDLA
jgi:hypothetical protein